MGEGAGLPLLPAAPLLPTQPESQAARAVCSSVLARACRRMARASCSRVRFTGIPLAAPPLLLFLLVAPPEPPPPPLLEEEEAPPLLQADPPPAAAEANTIIGAPPWDSAVSTKAWRPVRERRRVCNCSWGGLEAIAKVTSGDAEEAGEGSSSMISRSRRASRACSTRMPGGIGSLGTVGGGFLLVGGGLHLRVRRRG